MTMDHQVHLYHSVYAGVNNTTSNREQTKATNKINKETFLQKQKHYYRLRD